MKQLTKAILEVMQDVKGIDKTMSVGTGKMQYKGVPDQEVKKILGSSMRKHGLVMLPVKIEPTTRIDRWEQTDQWGTKMKQSVFTEVMVTYKLMHESGEFELLSGYGQGVDSQDKGAGKATTYALKYALLYAFLVPTGKIDDSDNTHSNDIETPVKQQPKEVVTAKVKINDERFINALKQIETGNYTEELMCETFELTEPQRLTLREQEVKLILNKKIETKTKTKTKQDEKK